MCLQMHMSIQRPEFDVCCIFFLYHYPSYPFGTESLTNHFAILSRLVENKPPGSACLHFPLDGIVTCCCVQLLYSVADPNLDLCIYALLTKPRSPSLIILINRKGNVLRRSKNKVYQSQIEPRLTHSSGPSVFLSDLNTL